MHSPNTTTWQGAGGGCLWGKGCSGSKENYLGSKDENLSKLGYYEKPNNLSERAFHGPH